MPISDAFVDTNRAQRYLAQLGKHLAHGPGEIRAELDGDRHLDAAIGAGTCSMHADPLGLRLRAAAPDAETLNQIQRGVAGRLEQIGHRDGLVVCWSPAPTEPPNPSPPTPTPRATTTGWTPRSRPLPG